MATLNIGVYLFDNMTMLDDFAPLQFFSFVESFHSFSFAKQRSPLRSDCGAILAPDYGFTDCPEIDVLVVP